MDIFSHTLWGYGLFGRKRPGLAMFFGAMPDLISFGAFTLIRLLQNQYVPGKPPLEVIPSWCFLFYDIGHSLLIALLSLLLVYCKNRSFAFAMLAWPFHILLDIPFHTKDYFPTKLLYPLSDFSFNGIAWSQPIVWLPNLAGVILVVAYRIRSRTKI